MKGKDNDRGKSFEYSLDKKRSTTVEFDVGFVNGKKVALNIRLISNWRAHYPKKPKIELSSNNEYGFYENGVFITSGDIQQMIKRINHIIEEY